jgi:hypothetical protein
VGSLTKRANTFVEAVASGAPIEVIESFYANDAIHKELQNRLRYTAMDARSLARYRRARGRAHRGWARPPRAGAGGVQSRGVLRSHGACLLRPSTCVSMPWPATSRGCSPSWRHQERRGGTPGPSSCRISTSST